MRSQYAIVIALACALGPAAGGCADPTPAPVTPPTPPPAPTPEPTRIPVRDNVTPGMVNPVDPGTTPPEMRPSAPLSDPAMNDGRVGRAPRRLNVFQLRASLLNAVGVTWRQPRRILSADFPVGYYDDPNADMLSLLSLTLGQPDYNNFTSESIEPGAVFSKLVNDAARKACRDGIELDLSPARPRARRILLRNASETDTLASNETAVRANIAYLVMRFWARTVQPSDAAVTGLVDVFRVASTAPAEPGTMLAAGTPVDGWRAVCVALATDPQFLTY
jgi:hypothetical protein